MVCIVLIFEGSIFIKLKSDCPQFFYDISNDEERIFNCKTEEKIIDDEWRLIIPVIGLDGEIKNGISDEILNSWIGHFEMTGILDGNICLAAHNRGYAVNYFENIKNLKLDDEIIYYYHGIKKEYKVSKINIIKDTQVEVLDDTNENIITLITCVENEPEYRRCIVGIKS